MLNAECGDWRVAATLCIGAGLACATAIAAAATDTAEPMNGNVFLYLDRGLRCGSGQWVELELEFPVRGGNWPDRGWGYATWSHRGHHLPRIVENRTDGDLRRLTVEMDVGPDNWGAGGWATYDIEIHGEGDRLTGTFTGKVWGGGPLLGGAERQMPSCLQRTGGAGFRDGAAAHRALKETADAAETQGTVRGHIGPVWPGGIPGHTPPLAGEHPRLAFRKRDIPALRKRAAETPEGKAMLARSLAVLGSGPSDSDKFTTWPAVGYGFAYVMTGREEYAQRAREIVYETIFRNPAGRQGQGVSQDIHHGPRLQALALAFDFCYDAWDTGLLLRCIDEIQRRTWELRLGEFEGRLMSGYNPNPWSNHNGIRVACAGLGALAILGETNSLGKVMEDAEAIADLMAWESREHFRTALGGGSYCMEGGYYKVMTLQRGFAYFPPAYENVLGRKLDAGPYADFDMIGYAMESRPGNPIPSLDPVLWSVDIHTAPGDMLPGVKWLFDRAVGLQGDGSFGIGNGLHAPFITANYPYEVDAKHPNECFRWMSPDPRKGHWVFRPTIRDKNDILLTLNMKSENLRGSWAAARAGPHCRFDLWGFGRQWLGDKYLVKLYRAPGGNEHLGGVITSWRTTADRTCVMNWNMDRAYYQQVNRKVLKDPESYAREKNAKLLHVPGWYEQLDFGTRATRSMAVDCSGRSGAPLLVALVEQVHVPSVGREEKGPSGSAASTGPATEPTDGQEALRALFLKETGIRIRTGAKTEAPGSEAPPDTTTRWSLPLPADRVPPMVRVKENRFMLGYSTGASLTGVLVGPSRLRTDSVVSDAEGTYFCVFTLQEEGWPEFEIEGEGLDAVVRVGKRVVRFADGTLVLEERPGAGT